MHPDHKFVAELGLNGVQPSCLQSPCCRWVTCFDVSLFMGPRSLESPEAPFLWPDTYTFTSGEDNKPWGNREWRGDVQKPTKEYLISLPPPPSLPTPLFVLLLATDIHGVPLCPLTSLTTTLLISPIFQVRRLSPGLSQEEQVLLGAASCSEKHQWDPGQLSPGRPMFSTFSSLQSRHGSYGCCLSVGNIGKPSPSLDREN